MTYWQLLATQVKAFIPYHPSYEEYWIEMQQEVGNFNSETSTVYQSTVLDYTLDPPEEFVEITFESLEPGETYFFRAAVRDDESGSPMWPSWPPGP